ncbi:alpha/beta hydrolase [Lactiplantibacillus garii]|uniref:Alpha/beta hydrolase n=1 Tax=Lactiplantibacillus garii TaxID=2306423 RepID=A0A3R8KK73_9LACO|nr:alpha/beta hydrolase [Lactiplantibacillus garii]RRK11472.1 alpha/beta hydrolase [Lactiplantibacillus garii]
MRRQKTIICLALISAAVVTLSGAYWQWRSLPLTRVRVRATNVPTIFVAGDYAKAFSTNGFVHRLSAHQLMTRAMLVKVAKNGTVTFKRYAPLRHNPTIQVVFADNHHPKRQAHQLTTVMHLLKQRYHVQRFNAVGHSSGGNIIFDYLTTSHAQAQPRINRFVSIGTNYPELPAKLHRFPRQTAVLNVAGQIWRTSGDGEVSLNSVMAFSRQLQRHHFSVQTVVIHGGPIRAEHSMLHINPSVDAQLVQFLYGISD